MPRKQAKQKNDVATQEEQRNGTCFVIMPFGDWFDYYYEQIFRPAIIEGGLTPKRADDIYRSGMIIQDIWTFTNEATIILAELSSKNSNVLYELGLAHALAKPAILVSESLDDIPFDLRSLRVINYDKNNPDWGSTLQDKITKAISEVLAEPNLAVLPTFLQVKKTSPPPSVTEVELDILELKQELNRLNQRISNPKVSTSTNYSIPRLLALADSLQSREMLRTPYLDEQLLKFMGQETKNRDISTSIPDQVKLRPDTATRENIKPKKE